MDLVDSDEGQVGQLVEGGIVDTGLGHDGCGLRHDRWFVQGIEAAPSRQGVEPGTGASGRGQQVTRELGAAVEEPEPSPRSGR